MKTQTAVEWLDEKLNAIRLDVDRNAINFIDLSLQKAKEMEKQQQGYSEEDMKQAYLDGCKIQLTNTYHVTKWFKQFKKK